MLVCVLAVAFSVGEGSNKKPCVISKSQFYFYINNTNIFLNQFVRHDVSNSYHPKSLTKLVRTFPDHVQPIRFNFLMVIIEEIEEEEIVSQVLFAQMMRLDTTQEKY